MSTDGEAMERKYYGEKNKGNGAPSGSTTGKGAAKGSKWLGRKGWGSKTVVNGVSLDITTTKKREEDKNEAKNKYEASCK